MACIFDKKFKNSLNVFILAVEMERVECVYVSHSAVLNRLLSLLSLTAEQRLNSGIPRKLLDEPWTKTSSSAFVGECGEWANVNGLVFHTVLNQTVCSTLG